jgi:hypothetical protein
MVGAIGADGVSAVSAKTAAAGHADDSEIIRLGAEFDAKHGTMMRAAAAHREKDDAFMAEATRRGLVQGGLIPAPAFDQAKYLAFKRLTRETGCAAAWQYLMNCHEEIDAIAKRIRDMPAATLRGLAIKVRVLGYDIGMYESAYGEAPDEWEAECYGKLVASLDALISSQGGQS